MRPHVTLWSFLKNKLQHIKVEIITLFSLIMVLKLIYWIAGKAISYSIFEPLQVTTKFNHKIEGSSMTV